MTVNDLINKLTEIKNAGYGNVSLIIHSGEGRTGWEIESIGIPDNRSDVAVIIPVLPQSVTTK